MKGVSHVTGHLKLSVSRTDYDFENYVLQKNICIVHAEGCSINLLPCTEKLLLSPNF